MTPPSTKNFTLNTKTPAPPPPPPKKEDEKPKQSTNPYLKNIRTYEGDIAEHLATRGTSKVSMAIAESVRQGDGEVISNAPRQAPQQEIAPKSGIAKKIILIVIALILIGAGGIAGYILFEKSPIAATTAIDSKAPQQRRTVSLVPSDSQSVVPTDGATGREVFSRIKQAMAKAQSPKTIRELVFTQVKDGVTYRTTAMDLAYLSSVPVPDIILRTLTPEWMFGVYTPETGTNKYVFVVVTTNLFQNAFAGMLGWENTVLEDINGAAGDTNYDRPKGEFKDMIVRNKDVRAFVTDNGRMVLAYSFIDNNTLVVTENIETLDAVMTRLENKAYVR